MMRRSPARILRTRRPALATAAAVTLGVAALVAAPGSIVMSSVPAPAATVAPAGRGPAAPASVSPSDATATASPAMPTAATGPSTGGIAGAARSPLGLLVLALGGFAIGGVAAWWARRRRKPPADAT